MDTEKVVAYVGAVVAILSIVIGLGLLLAWPTMLLWNNCLIPATTGLHEIGLMQAWGINALTGILFKSTVSK